MHLGSVAGLCSIRMHGARNLVLGANESVLRKSFAATSALSFRVSPAGNVLPRLRARMYGGERSTGGRFLAHPRWSLRFGGFLFGRPRCAIHSSRSVSMPQSAVSNRRDRDVGFRLHVMNKKAQKPAIDDLRSAYAYTTQAFNAASAKLTLKFAANLPPTDEQIATEEKARAAVIAARRELWRAQRLLAQPISEPGAAVLPDLHIGTQQAPVGD
jgi:hypothetical protein